MNITPILTDLKQHRDRLDHAIATLQTLNPPQTSPKKTSNYWTPARRKAQSLKLKKYWSSAKAA